MRKFLSSMLAVGACILVSGVASAANRAPSAVVKKSTHPVKVAPVGAGYGLSLTDLTMGYFDGEYPGYEEPFFLQPIPLTTTVAGYPMVTTLQMQSTFYTSAPTLTYTLMQAGAVVDTQTLVFPFDLVADEEAAGSFADTAPTTTGLCTLVVTVTDGSTTIGSMTSHFFVIP